MTWYTTKQTAMELVCTAGYTVISYYFSNLDVNIAVSAPRAFSLAGLVSFDFNSIYLLKLVSVLVIILRYFKETDHQSG